MKKFILMLSILFAVFLGFNVGNAENSTTKTADASIVSGKGHFLGIIVITDNTNAVTVDIYDNASSASGAKLIPTWTVTTSSSNMAQTLSFGGNEVRYQQGIYVDVTCVGTVSYMVYYNPN
jgi:uncharacterized protein YcnI